NQTTSNSTYVKVIKMSPLWLEPNDKRTNILVLQQDIVELLHISNYVDSLNYKWALIKTSRGEEGYIRTAYINLPPNYNNIKSNKVSTTSTKKQDTTKSTQTKVIQVASPSLDKKSLKEELKYWKELYDEELISQAEYDAKRKELLSGASISTTTKVVEPKVEKKKVVTQTTVVESDDTNTIDLSFKDKNYINQSLLSSLGFFSNDSKIRNYCENKFPELHIFMECYAQNVKKNRNYKKASEVYDLYVDYGRYIAWEVLIGNLSESSARYQLSAKKKELGDAYADENKAK
ncbi:uncharacterized protein METZ01_LOCUS391176, partial [marine metagenome]